MPFAAALRNQKVIFDTLCPYLDRITSCLEIGSGAGDHFNYFAKHYPKVRFIPSEQPSALASLHLASYPNLAAPLAIDVAQYDFSLQQYDMLYTANTFHIMPLSAVKAFCQNLYLALNPGGYFVVYGAFCYDGAYTSESNAEFNKMLKAQNPDYGIRDFELLAQTLKSCRFTLLKDVTMPKHNQLIIWQYNKENI